MKRTICKVRIIRTGFFKGKFGITCNACDRALGTFSQHESAMNWAQAHATSSKHIRGNDG